VRRRGYQLHDAQDLTQAFFAQLLEKNYVQSADRARGKFRTFLLASMQHFLANHWRDAHTQKRGGQAAFVSFEEADAGVRDLAPALPGLSPERLFEKQWAMTMLDQALSKLENEFTASGKAQWFQELKVFLTGDKRETSYADLAVKLSSAEGTLRTAVSRLRRQYADLVRAEVAQTVANPGEVEEELRALFAALSA
jgi:RNA polymerase sigma-70 factor (ECF subfamily)